MRTPSEVMTLRSGSGMSAEPAIGGSDLTLLWPESFFFNCTIIAEFLDDDYSKSCVISSKYLNASERNRILLCGNHLQRVPVFIDKASTIKS